MSANSPSGDDPNTPTTTSNLLTLWDFEQTGSGTADDIAPRGGDEDAHLSGDAAMTGGALSLDGHGDYAVARPDADWQALDEGRIELTFNQTAHVGTSDDTLLSRDSNTFDDGGHLNIGVTQSGSVIVRHQDAANSYFYETPDGFFAPGDDVRVTYAWDSEGEEGFYLVENLTTGAVHSEEIEDQLTLDNGATSEPFTIGASQRVSGDNVADNLREYFNGTINYVAIYDTAEVPDDDDDDDDDSTDGHSGDFVVSGDATANLIDAAYTGDPEGDLIDAGDNPVGTDADIVDAGAGDDTILGGADADTIFAGAGDDSVEGGAGDDVVFGDSALQDGGATGLVRESFEWDLAPDLNGPAPIENGDPINGFTQNTGNVDVTFSVSGPVAGILNQFEADTQLTSGIDSGSETVDANSSFYSETQDIENTPETYTLSFADPVQNVSFRVNDIDGDGVVRIQAFDVNGAPIEVELTLGANLTGADTDGVAGIDTARGDGLYADDTAPQYSMLVSIPGPVSSITLDHAQVGPANSGINVTDVFFDVPVGDPGEGFDDTIDGGAGDDLIYGQTGDNSLLGGIGNDTLYGDDQDETTAPTGNLIVNGSFENTTGADPESYGFVAGESGIPGWTEASGADFDIHSDGRGGVPATDGDNWLDLEATPGNVRVGQDVAGVVEGETYTLTFDAGDASWEPQSGPGENLVHVYWGGELIATIDPPAGGMASYSFDLVGGAGDGSDRLEFEGTGDADNIGASVDNVSLIGKGTETGEAGNDTIEGGEGADMLFGQGGDDLLEGGAEADTVDGGTGSDTIIAGSGDSVSGGADADLIRVDPTLTDGLSPAPIIADGAATGDDDDTLDLTAYTGFQNLAETVDPDGNSTSGSVEVLTGDGTVQLIQFSEIENLLLPNPVTPGDGIVDGEDFGETMDVGYDDANLPTDGGGDMITDGADSIRGNGGDDSINAGGGNDTVDGGDDDDTIDGQGGNDQILGGRGEDLITGGSGNDTLDGGRDDDTISGGGGRDSILGGNGDDELGGAQGNDTLDGGEGRDTLTGGSGNDVLDGGEDDDTISGNSGRDTITDTDGDNYVDSGVTGLPDRGFPVPGGTPGAVQLDPNTNDDRDSVTTGDGHDTILTGDDRDTIDAGDGDNVIDAGYDDDIVTTGEGDDYIVTGEGNDTIDAGDGDDTIFGGPGPLPFDLNLIDDNVNPVFDDPILDNGDDLIDAGAGDDLVFGEDDNDTILGGAGNDTLDGGIDDDSIEGGSGDDLIIGGQGADTMKGGTGNDTFTVGTFTDPIFGDDYVEGAGDLDDPNDGDVILGGEDGDGDDIDILDLTGAGPLEVIYDDSVDTDNSGDPGEAGRVIFYSDAARTDVIGTLTFEEIEQVIPCFTPGTRIATPRGEVPVEALREGDKVLTRDNGIQEIRWIGSRSMTAPELSAAPNLRPILVRAGSLGGGLPERDMLVSPQHRMLVTGQAAQLYFGESEVLVAAKHLTGTKGIEVAKRVPTNIHFMFDRHEVVLSDGAWTESFQPGDMTLGALGAEARAEILALFPELETRVGRSVYAAARRTLKAHEARLLQL